MIKEIGFILNEKRVSVRIDTLTRLLDVLRNEFQCLGVKEGCGEGECGACSILLDGKLVNSCIIPIGQVENSVILTIEGLKKTERYEVLKKAFQDAGAVQCGFCTPGMIMAAEALLSRNPKPSEDDIRVGISGNLCRCTGYSMIVEAVKLASIRGDKLW